MHLVPISLHLTSFSHAIKNLDLATILNIIHHYNIVIIIISLLAIVCCMVCGWYEGQGVKWHSTDHGRSIIIPAHTVSRRISLFNCMGLYII